MFQKAGGTTRGHSEKFQTQRATGYRHHFFSTRVVKMWNSLSDDTVQARIVNELKSESEEIGEVTQTCIIIIFQINQP